MTFLTNQAVADQSILTKLLVAGDNERVRIVLNYDREPHFNLQYLDNPYRLVINFEDSAFNNITPQMPKQSLVADVRIGGAGANKTRLILTMLDAFRVENSHVEKNTNDDGWLVYFDIVKVSHRAFLRASQEALEAFMQPRNEMPAATRRFRVVIDAGHGGVDSGAVGHGRVLEKNITLAFARVLRDSLLKYENIDVFLTRDSDVFLRLRERVDFAREKNADLFISIHADSIHDKTLRGATVYTISDRASDAMARRLAEDENKADLLDGLPADEAPEVSNILIDLARRETLAFSTRFADSVLDQLRGNILLINNPHRYAGFQVLRAHDIPSILFEMGYLSNREDEKLITDEHWQRQTAEHMRDAIIKFAQLKGVDVHAP